MTDFETLIQEACDRAAGSAMTWGHDDCLLWIADIYREALGIDPAAEFRGRYKTGAGAYAQLGRNGVLGVLERVAGERNWSAIVPADANTGDLGMVATGQSPGGVIFNGAFWIGRSDYGFTAWRTSVVTHAWSVC